MTADTTYDGMFYLCVKRMGKNYNPKLKFRVAVKQPSLEAGEVAIQCNLSLPRTLFQRPMLKAELSVPPGSVSPAVIEASVAEDIGEIIRQQTGLDIKIEIKSPQDQSR